MIVFLSKLLPLIFYCTHEDAIPIFIHASSITTLTPILVQDGMRWLDGVGTALGC